MRGWLIALVLVYVALDFANPLMPGAVTFEADESVDGVRAPRPRVESEPATVTRPPGPERVHAIEPLAVTASRPGEHRRPRATPFVPRRAAPAAGDTADPH